LGERVVRNDEVSGSIPLSSTISDLHAHCLLGTIADEGLKSYSHHLVGSGPMTAREVKSRLIGVHPCQIPIGATKRRSLAALLGGLLFRIGRIDARKAFVLQAGDLWLLYVSPSYSGYRYVARKLFGATGSDTPIDYDHALGRAIALELGVNYVLLLAVTRSANRSHGHLERGAIRSDRVELRKHCFADERIILKWLSIGTRGRSGLRTYARTDSHNPDLTNPELQTMLNATGFGTAHLHSGYLTEISR
jgi:hypothetical protein